MAELVFAAQVAPGALSVVLGVVGALVGLSASATAARMRLLRQRSMELQANLQETLEDLERAPARPTVLREVTDRQANAVQVAAGLARGHLAVRQLVTASLGVASAVVSAVLIAQQPFEIHLSEAAPVAFVASLGAAFLGGVILLQLARRETLVLSGRMRVGGLTVDLVSPPDSDSEALWLEAAARRWLAQDGWNVAAAPPASGFDYVCSNESSTIYVEVKSGARLTLTDVDGVLGSLTRIESGPASRVEAVLFAHAEAIAATAGGTLEVVNQQPLRLIGIEPDGTAREFSGGSVASGRA